MFLISMNIDDRLYRNKVYRLEIEQDNHDIDDRRKMMMVIENYKEEEIIDLLLWEGYLKSTEYK